MKHSLELILKLMIIMLVLAMVVVLGAQIFTGESNKSKPLIISIANMPLGQIKEIEWENQRFLLVKRPKNIILSLSDLDGMVHDPYSKMKPLPEQVSKKHRGLMPDFLLVYAQGEKCLVEFVTEETAEHSPPQPWLGGFFDECASQWYDMAGRAYKQSGFADHLIVPDYRIVGSALVLGE